MSSPMISQYLTIKEQYQDDIVFFRLGDFYEMFFEDAKIGSKVLDLVLTRRRNKADGDVPMCGVPYHSSTNYISKLVKAGYNVAICEQTEAADPKKELVKREVVRVITPGTVLLDSVLEESRNNFLVALKKVKLGYAIALADVSTGIFKAGVIEESSIVSELYKLSPKEIVFPEDYKNSYVLEPFTSLQKNTKFVFESKWSFTLDQAQTFLCNQFKVVSLDGFGFSGNDESIGAAGALMTYLKFNLHTNLEHITSLSRYQANGFMKLDPSTILNLELFNSNSSLKGTSFFDVIKKTRTPMGSRLLYRWVLEPLVNIDHINQRLNMVEVFTQKPEPLQQIISFLDNMFDIERILARLSSGISNARDLVLLKNSLAQIPPIKSQLQELPIPEAEDIRKAFKNNTSLIQLLETSLKADPPHSIREGGFIKPGFNAEVDELTLLHQGGRNWILATQEAERLKTGISSLKINFNKVFGYYIEISNSHKHKVPTSYIKKQTLVNAERYITPEIKEYEEKILSSESLLYQKELELFEQIRFEVLKQAVDIQSNSSLIAQIDCLVSQALSALQYNYTKPKLVHSPIIDIKAGRHPIVETLLKDDFIANDTFLHNTDQQLILLTGPNMGGKSTYIRQVALIVLMAQIGGFIPAKQGTIGIVDHIFSRVGASDNLSEGQSTFMVEMNEVSNILNNATSQSLIILDEVGRGTSTFDGMSLASSIVHHIHDTIKARTLFATHYHELLDLETKFSGVTNFSVQVKESGGEILFLRIVQKGGADKSYGIAIAKLAGFPNSVLQKARQELLRLEQSHRTLAAQPSLFNTNIQPEPEKEVSDKDENLELLKTSIQEVDLNNMTPMQALEMLKVLQEQVNSEN